MARVKLGGDGGVGLGWQEREGEVRPALSLFYFWGAGTFYFCLSLRGGWGPDYDRQGRSGAREKVIIKQLTAAAEAAAEPLSWPFGLHIAGYRIHDYTHTHTQYCF